MKLSEYFIGIGIKRLSAVEIEPLSSNQHEINGINEFRTILGTEKQKFESIYIYLAEDESKSLNETGFSTWYDSRANHETRTEYRLYYSSNEIVRVANSGDLLALGRTSDNKLVIIIAPQGSTSEQQLLWLFGVEEINNRFVIKDYREEDINLGYSAKYILHLLGFDQEETAPDYLDLLLEKFGNQFPSTSLFSEFSRSTIKDISPVDEPDKTLLLWLEREELLFRTLEKHIVKERLIKGFGDDGTDVDEFIKLSLSVQNRRKSRAGFSFEHNLAVLFRMNDLKFSQGAYTERNNKPDFIFPGEVQYHSLDFPADKLTMLGAKTSLKDRWRQVLTEAVRIPQKHLITIEPGISQSQTEEMTSQNVQLIIPAEIITSYNESQKKYIIDVKEFIVYVKSK